MKLIESSRTVWVGPDYVLKVAADAWGRRHNRNEADLWDRVKRGSNRKFFAPVLGSCPKGNWVLMKTVVGTPACNTKRKTKEKVAQLEKKYGLQDVADHWFYGDDPAENRDNWVMTKKGPVILDYGV